MQGEMQKDNTVLRLAKKKREGKSQAKKGEGHIPVWRRSGGGELPCQQVKKRKFLGGGKKKGF